MKSHSHARTSSLGTNSGMGAHQRTSSRHLPYVRNRLGSDAVSRGSDAPPRRQLSEKEPLSSDSPYDDHDPYFSRSSSPTKSDWSPAVVENGSAIPRQSVSSSRGMLPHGAATPMEDTTDQGNPIVQFPPPPPTWSNLPNKGQLAILALSRFVDFFQMAALQTFMVHQLRSFDPQLSDLDISHQAGVLQGAFTAAQIVTSILWGRAADQPSLGRKTVLNIGLVGTGFGCIGVAFSRTYGQAVFWRLVSGAVNGTVGSARTMVAEITPKPWHPRAFLLLPAAFNVANVAGPILAGLFADPVVNLPNLFGENSTFGGEGGVGWMRTYPYALANLMSTVLLFTEAILVHYGLEETLKGKRPMDISKFDPVALVRNMYQQIMQARNSGYRLLQQSQSQSQSQRHGLLSDQHGRGSVEMDRLTPTGEKEQPRPVQRLAFRRIWTPNVLWTLLSIAIFDFHMGAFANLWILFLATPREFIPQSNPIEEAAPPPPPDGDALIRRGAEGDLLRRSMFKFSSGLAFPPPTIGFAMAIIGFIGVALQFLLYPWANGKFGLMRCFRGSLFFFPLAYYLAPYLALLPSTSPPPNPASGNVIWLGISFVLFLQVAARTFALPASIILLNNSSPHPSVLATIHGIGNACSATFRTLGPMLAGYWYGIWTERGIVGMAWWIVATVASVGCVASFKVRNGSGHEIFLPGEEGELKEGESGIGSSGDGR